MSGVYIYDSVSMIRNTNRNNSVATETDEKGEIGSMYPHSFFVDQVFDAVTPFVHSRS